MTAREPSAVEVIAEARGDVLHAIDHLSDTLRTVRALRRVSQREVARVTGVSFATVSRVEAGNDCTLSAARALLGWIAGEVQP